MDIEIAAAAEGFAIVRNLFALYVHDMSEFIGLDVDAAGRFAIPESLVSYWEGSEAAQRYPFLIRADGRLAGFALVRQMGAGSGAYDMGEFFVLKRYRRSGLGRQVAWQLFDRFTGTWEVRELPANTLAQTFWRRIIDDYTHGAFTETQEFFATMGREFVVQRFRTDGT